MSEPRMAWIAEDPASKAVVELARKVAETGTYSNRADMDASVSRYRVPLLAPRSLDALPGVPSFP